MRILSGLVTAVLSLSACGGGDGGDRVFVQIEGLESQLVGSVTVTEGGDVFLLRGPGPDPLPLRWNGERLDAIDGAGGGAARFHRGGDGSLSLHTLTELYRIDGLAAVPLGAPFEFFGWASADAAGGLHAYGTSFAYLAPGATDWSTVASTVPNISLNYGAAWGQDGSLYAYNAVGGGSGIVRLEPDGAGVSMALDCNRQELSFCNSEARLVGNGSAPPYAWISNFAQEGGGILYRFDGDALTEITHGPPDNQSVPDLAMSPGGDLYVVAAADNTASSIPHVYVLDGDGWRDVAQMPGHGAIAIAADGTIYAGLSNVFGNVGGLWVLEP